MSKTYPVWVNGRCVEMTDEQRDAREVRLASPSERIAWLESRVKKLEAQVQQLLKAKS